MTITITGASDDLIEIDGDIREEFPYTEHSTTPGGGDLLAFSDGTVLRIKFDINGVWRITPVARGTGNLRIEQAAEDDADDRTDAATVDAAWVVHGIGWAKR